MINIQRGWLGDYMLKRIEAIAFCSKLEHVYEDYPFRDSNWTVMRHNENRKV